MSRFGIKKMRRKISQNVRSACKFRYIVTYEYLEMKSREDWKPTELNILWFRGHRTKSSIKPTWSIQIPNQLTKTSTCTAKWNPPYSVELLVTLYKDISGSTFKKKDYMFVMEDICGSKRKKLAIFPCNLSAYVSMDGETSDLEMEFKSLSKKVISAKCGLKIRCEFIKEGTSLDDDMQSNFSHMSEAEEFSRLSELTEVSDEDDFTESDRYDDMPKADESYKKDEDFQPWQGNHFVQQNAESSEELSTSPKTKSKPSDSYFNKMRRYTSTSLNMGRRRNKNDSLKEHLTSNVHLKAIYLNTKEQLGEMNYNQHVLQNTPVEHSLTQMAEKDEEVVQVYGVLSGTTRAAFHWSKFVAEMNSFEWKQISIRNPLSSSTKKKKNADQLREKHDANTESVSKANSVPDYDPPDHHDKQLVKVPSLESDDDGAGDNNATDDDYNDEDELSKSTSSLASAFSSRSKNGLRTSLKETLKNVTTKTTKEWEAKIQEKTNRIWDLERENKDLVHENRELVVENNRLQDDVFNLQKQRDELQTEISELQILVEDLKTRLSQTEAEHKQLQEEEKELLARMNLHGWLCKRGIKGITGRNWRRRWFATDKSGKLYYYKQNNNSTPQGFIDLDQIISVQDQGQDKQDKNNASFNVIVDKRKYELLAHDSDEKQKWINALDYLRHWRSHTTKFLTDNKPQDYDDALNPFVQP